MQIITSEHKPVVNQSFSPMRDVQALGVFNREL